MGWIERFVESGRARSPAAPYQYHEVTGLFVLSTVVGPRIYMHLASGKVFPVLWPMLLGDSGTTKKTTCMEFAVDILSEVMPDQQIVESFNVEGLVDELNEHTEAGVAHVYAVQDEFGRLLSDFKSKEYMKSLKDVMMKLYDGKPPGRRTRKVNARFKQVYMTMLAGTTEKRLVSLLDRSDVEDGFWPRLLPVYGEGNGYQPQPEMTPEMIRDQRFLVQEIKGLRAYLDANPPIRMAFTRDARDFWDAWCYDLDVSVHNGKCVGAIAARMNQNFVKMCMLWEVSDALPTPGTLKPLYHVGLDRVKAVAAKIDPILKVANDLYWRLGGNRVIEDVCKMIDRFGSDGIGHSVLLRHSGLGHKHFKSVIITLVESGRIDAEEGVSKTGKPMIRYKVHKVDDSS